MFKLLFPAALALAGVTVAAAECTTAPYARCGAENATELACCPTNYYCLPYSPDFFQCVPMPMQCPTQLTNVDLYGDDLTTIYGITATECCAQCGATAGCKAYTFYNNNPGRPACYLKKGAGERKIKAGVVSGILTGATFAPTTTPVATTAAPTTTTPVATTTAPVATTAAVTSAPNATAAPSTNATSSCATPSYGACGSIALGASCCPSSFYCQPWTDSFYQCIPVPSKCSVQQTEIDYYGNDIKTVYVTSPTECCDACAKTTGCRAYTYINNNPGQPACYLKGGTGTATHKAGAVSGRLDV